MNALVLCYFRNRQARRLFFITFGLPLRISIHATHFFIHRAMTYPIRKIAISTGGGDAPGLNAVIKAVVTTAYNKGWQCVGIRDGYNGLLFPEKYPDGGVVPLSVAQVQHITPLGGTIIGSTNKGNPLKYNIEQPDGTIIETDISDRLIAAVLAHEIDAVVAVGGDGSLSIAYELYQKGLRIVGVPKTIDNDLERTVVTFGFDTAVAFATECIDRLHTTAQSHGRLLVIEVMGRYAGWIALYAGIAASADVILIPELPYDIQKVVDHLEKKVYPVKRYGIVVVAEGATPKNGTVSVVENLMGTTQRLGGIGEKVAAQLQQLTDIESRAVVLGHLLRGGSPTPHDRIISLRFGAAAVRALAAGKNGVMVAIDPPEMLCVPLADIHRRMKLVDLNSDTIDTARDLGICFGDV